MLKVNEQIGQTFVDYTPSFYKRTIANWKQGYYKEITALYEQCETDSYCGGCVEARQDGYKKNWRLTEASQSKQDIAIKEFVEGVLLELDIYDLFDFIHDARLKEFSVIGYDWEVINNKQVITAINKINQKYFRRDMKDNRKIKIDWGNRLEEIPPDAALVCESVKLPLLISVARDFILKEFGIECFASFIENFGEAFIIARYPPGASEKFKAELNDAVNKLGASTRGIAPIGSELQVIESHKNTGDHSAFIDLAKTGIVLTLLGHENAVKNSSGLQVGQNDTPWKALRSKTLSDIIFIEKFLYKMIKLLVDKNFSAVTQYPLFRIDNSEPIDSTKQLAIIDSAYSKGYKIAADEYAKLGLIKADDQEPFLQRDFNNPADAGF
jgi:phage gp29-like protein